MLPLDLPDLYDVPGPWLRAGFVTTLDGTVAVDGTSTGLGGTADKAVFRALRTVADAVLVGHGTARDEDYGAVPVPPAAAAWRANHDRSSDVPLVVISRSGRVDPTARWLSGPALLVVPRSAEVADLPVEVLRVGVDDVDLVELLAELRLRGLTRLLCEGGPGLLADLLAAGLVDELCLTHEPLLLGGPGLLPHPVPATRLELTQLLVDDPGVLLARWRVVRSADGTEGHPDRRLRWPPGPHPRRGGAGPGDRDARDPG